ncbi:hypothetical protein D3C76_1007670 [compost metagenome]
MGQPRPEPGGRLGRRPATTCPGWFRRRWRGGGAHHAAGLLQGADPRQADLLPGRGDRCRTGGDALPRQTGPPQLHGSAGRADPAGCVPHQRRPADRGGSVLRTVHGRPPEAPDQQRRRRPVQQRRKPGRHDLQRFLAIHRRPSACLQGRRYPVRRGVQQGRLPLPADPRARLVGGRLADHHQAEGAGTAGHADQHLRLRDVPADQPDPGRLRNGRLPGPHPD